MVVVACPHCGFLFGRKYEDVVAVLKLKRKGGWSLSELSRELHISIPLAYSRIELLEANGVVKSKTVISKTGKRRVIKLVKKGLRKQGGDETNVEKEKSRKI
jgi:predicted transcriptional regulator